MVGLTLVFCFLTTWPVVGVVVVAPVARDDDLSEDTPLLLPLPGQGGGGGG